VVAVEVEVAVVVEAGLLIEEDEVVAGAALVVAVAICSKSSPRTCESSTRYCEWPSSPSITGQSCHLQTQTGANVRQKE
jgi:hypothetical protein